MEQKTRTFRTFVIKSLTRVFYYTHIIVHLFFSPWLWIIRELLKFRKKKHVENPQGNTEKCVINLLKKDTCKKVRQSLEWELVEMVLYFRTTPVKQRKMTDQSFYPKKHIRGIHLMNRKLHGTDLYLRRWLAVSWSKLVISLLNWLFARLSHWSLFGTRIIQS
jgi:hypothetical protein